MAVLLRGVPHHLLQELGAFPHQTLPISLYFTTGKYLNQTGHNECRSGDGDGKALEKIQSVNAGKQTEEKEDDELEIGGKEGENKSSNKFYPFQFYTCTCPCSYIVS